MVRSGWPSGSRSLNPSPYAFSTYPFQLRSKCLFAPRQSVARNLSDMCHSTLEIGAALLNKSRGWRLFTDTGHGRPFKKIIISWMKSASSFREDWECRFPFDHYHRNLAIWGRAELQKGRPPAPFEIGGVAVTQMACKQWKNLSKKLDRCFVNGSRPTGEILVSWCANTKTYKAVRYFGNEQLTTLSTANRACEVRVMLGKSCSLWQSMCSGGENEKLKKRAWSRTLANVFRKFSRRCRKTQKSPRIPRLLEEEF